MRDVLEGEDQVKSKNTLYLPMPSGMTEAEYDAYQTRAAFTNYTARALDAMLGLVGKKKPVLIAPEPLHDLEDDITMTGVSLDSFAMDCLYETLAVGRGGVLVDYPEIVTPSLSVAEAEEDDNRPYFVLFKAKDILDWREGRVGNRRVLTYVKLRESFEEPVGPYSTEVKNRIRVLRIDDDGYCVFEVHEPVEGEDGKISFVIRDEATKKYVYQAGVPIRYIPFVFLGPMRNTASVQRPPLLDMAFLNIHHYQASADRNHAVHWADLPTPVFFGNLLTEDGGVATSVKLGPTSAINLATGGDAKYLEMMGHGIQPTKELMAEYTDAMAMLGNKILSMDSRAAEAAETAAIQRSGEQAILAAMANNISLALTQALNIAADYLGIGSDDEEIVYRLPTDYLPGAMESQTIIALIGALQSQALSREEFYDALVAGGVIRPDKTYEQHLEEIESMTPGAAGVPVVVGADSGGAFGDPSAALGTAKNPAASIAAKQSQPRQTES